MKVDAGEVDRETESRSCNTQAPTIARGCGNTYTWELLMKDKPQSGLDASEKVHEAWTERDG